MLMRYVFPIVLLVLGGCGGGGGTKHVDAGLADGVAGDTPGGTGDVAGSTDAAETPGATDARDAAGATDARDAAGATDARDAAGAEPDAADVFGLSGLTPNEGPPGRRVVLTGGGWRGGRSDVALDFGGVPVPVAVAVDGTASALVPPIAPAMLDVRLVVGGVSTAPLPFRVLAPAAMPMTQAEFATTLGDGLGAISTATRQVVLRVRDLDSVGWTTAQSAVVLGRLDAANAILEAAREQLLAASPDDAARMQSLFVESGVLAALGSAAGPLAARSSGIAAVQEALFLGDVTSFFITDIQPVLDIAEVVAAGAAVASGGTAAPIMLFSFAVKTALKIIDGVLDVLVPTDLQRIELKPRTFRPGQSVAVSGTAYFSCQEDFVGGSIQTVVGIILDGAFEALPAKPPATVKQAVADKIAEILISKGVDMITDGITDEFFGAGGPLFADVPVPYDPRSFDGGLVSMLARAMPDGDFSGFIGQLGTWGVPLLDVDVVAVEDPAVAHYEAWSGHLVGGAAAGTTRYRAWGLRFEDHALFWGLLTLAVPQGVLSEWADVVLDPNATTEPPNIAGITPVSGFESDSVTFTAEVTGATPRSLTWTFGRAATPSTSTDTAPRVTLGPVRVYTVTVRATNEYGEDERSFVLTVLKRGKVPGWVLVPAAPSAAPILAGGVRILVVDGYPAIFYGARYGGDLMMVRALDTQGRAWGTPVSVVPGSEWYDAAFSVGLVDGRPAIAHAAKVGSNAAIEYRRALDTGGAAWGAPVTVAGPWSFSSETSLMVTGGRPGVIYRNPDTRRVTWQRAIDADGTAFGVPVIVADEGASANVRGAAIAGNPAVVWVVGRQLHWARAIDTTGSEWGPSLTVYDLGSSSTSQLILEGSLVDVGGAPSVSFFTRLGSSDPSQLEAIRATNATGDAWSYAGTIDPGINARFSQSAWCGGRPAIVYEASSTLMERRLLWADFAAGDSWPAPMVIDTTGGGEPGIADVLGRPVIAFVQDTTNTLVYAFFDPWVEK